MHGYDVVDHNSLNPEIGTRWDFEEFVAALRAHGMGHILDFVPNHVGIMGADNAWWMDVLENGKASRFAEFFDIDWSPPNPALADQAAGACAGRAVRHDSRARGAAASIRARVRLVRRCSITSIAFPIDPRTYPVVLERALAAIREPAAGDA